MLRLVQPIGLTTAVSPRPGTTTIIFQEPQLVPDLLALSRGKSKEYATLPLDKKESFIPTKR